MGVQLVAPGIPPVVGSWVGSSRFPRSSPRPTDQEKHGSNWPVLDKRDVASGARAQAGARVQGLHRLEEYGACALGT